MTYKNFFAENNRNSTRPKIKKYFKKSSYFDAKKEIEIIRSQAASLCIPFGSLLKWIPNNEKFS